MAVPEELEPITAAQAIRLRPGMYLPKHTNVRNALVLEALCLPLAEAHCGSCSCVEIRLSGRTATIAYDGLGLSVAPDARGVSFAERIFTALYACRDEKTHQSLSHALCGHGIVVVSALSEALSLRTRTNGAEYLLRFLAGEIQGRLERIGAATDSGTCLSFTIDAAYAGQEPFDAKALEAAIRAKPVNLSGTKIRVLVE